MIGLKAEAEKADCALPNIAGRHCSKFARVPPVSRNVLSAFAFAARSMLSQPWPIGVGTADSKRLESSRWIMRCAANWAHQHRRIGVAFVEFLGEARPRPVRQPIAAQIQIANIAVVASNRHAFSTSVRYVRLKRSMKAFWSGLPVWMNIRLMSLALHHSVNA